MIKEFKSKKSRKVNPDKIYSLKERLLISTLSAFTLVFVVMIFGPLDIFTNNIEEIPFNLGDFIYGLLPYVLIIFFFFAAYLPLIKSTLINFLSALVLILPVGGCLQLIIFGSTGQITGDRAQVSMTRNILITVFWVVIATALIIMAFVLKKKWKSVVVFITILMVGMNTATLISDFVSNNVSDSVGSEYKYVLSKKDMYTLSPDENVVVLLVDRFDNIFLNYIKEYDNTFYEEFEKCLSGFTYFTDTTSVYGRTYPSVPFMISGIEYSEQYSPQEYLNTVYKSSDFLKDLKANEYKINLYLKDYYTYADGDTFIGIADNVEQVTNRRVSARTAASYLLQYSLARYVPQNITALSYGLTREHLSFAVEFECEDGMYVADDAEYYSGLKENGLSLSDDTSKAFTFIHLQGTHAPYIIDEYCMASEKETDPLSQAKGCLRLVLEYLNQMKELGIYDSSTIIITGDHGCPVNDLQTYMDSYVTTAMLVKPRNAQQDAMKYSSAQVSHKNLLPTIINDVGIVTQNNYGTSLFNVPEGKDTVRYYYKFNFSNASRDLSILKYKIIGNGNDFSNWTYDGITETEQDWY